MTCSYCDSPLYGDKCQTCGGTAPSNANTSGLIAEIDAEMEGRQRGYADVRGELLFRCRDDLVTAASAQAIIDRLKLAIWDGEDLPCAVNAVSVDDCERFCREAQAQHSAMISRATAAEARADRLAKDATGLLAEIASFGRAFVAAQESLASTSTPDAYDDAILAASVRYQSMVKTASALYRAALQPETQP